MNSAPFRPASLDPLPGEIARPPLRLLEQRRAVGGETASHATSHAGSPGGAACRAGGAGGQAGGHQAGGRWLTRLRLAAERVLAG